METKFGKIFFKCTGYDVTKGRAKRQFFEDICQVGVAISLVIVLWKLLITATNCANPVVVVVSGSMEPAYYRGDLLFVTNYDSESIRVGDVIIFSVKHHQNRLVHRVIKVHQNEDTLKMKILTKGDNNVYDDSTGLYAAGQKWLTRTDVHGKVKGYLPYIGYITILLTEYRPIIIVIACYILIHITKNEDKQTKEINETEEMEDSEN